MSRILTPDELQALHHKDDGAHERSLGDLVRVCRRSWRPWAIFVGVVGVLSIAVAFLLPQRYTATASIISVGSGMPQGTLGRLAKLANITPTRDELPPEMLTSILASRRLADKVLDKTFQAKSGDKRRLPFKNWLTGTEPGDEPKRDILYKKLAKATRFHIDPETRIVGLRVETRYPQLSADVANTYVTELGRYATEEHQNRSGLVRNFVSQRIDEVNGELRATEDVLHAFYATNRNYATTTDPDVIIERLRLERLVHLKTQALVSLTASLEAAIVDSRNEVPMIQVIDSAAVPGLRSWPRRSLLVGSSVLAAALLGLAIILLADTRRMVVERDEHADIAA